MEIGEKFYRADEFDKFDWSILECGEFKSSGNNYSFGKGGFNYINGEGWQITVYSGENDLQTETWELPKALSDFLDYQAEGVEKKTKIEISNQFKELIGLSIYE